MIIDRKPDVVIKKDMLTRFSQLWIPWNPDTCKFMSRSSVPFFPRTKFIVQFNFQNMRNIASQTGADQRATTPGSALNEFGLSEHLVRTNKFLCIKLTDNNVDKFGCEKHSLTTRCFFCMFSLVVKQTSVPVIFRGNQYPCFPTSFCKLSQI